MELNEILQTKTLPCLKIKRMLKKQINLLEKGKAHTSDKYKELIERWHEIKAYEKYFERPHILWICTCNDKFYSYMFADVFERKRQESIDWFLKFRIAASVAQNRGFTETEFNRRTYETK